MPIADATNTWNFDWKARAVYDLTTDIDNGGYGIRFANFLVGGVGNASLVLRPSVGGDPRLVLSYVNNVTGILTEYGEAALDFDNEQIELELRQSDGLVTGWWR